MTTILVAEDDADNRDILTEFLHDAGYAVVQASNAADAVAVSRAQHPALVLMDMQMPLRPGESELDEQAGLAATAQMRDSASTRQIPVLILSGHDPAAIRTAALAAGATAVAAKPYDFRALLDAVSNLAGAAS